MRLLLRRSLAGLTIVLLPLLLAVADGAAALHSQLAQVESVTARALFRVHTDARVPRAPWVDVDTSFLIGEGELRTDAKGRLTLLLAGGSGLRLQSATELDLAALRDEYNQGSTRIVLRTGQIVAEPAPQQNNGGPFVVVSPHAEIAGFGGRFTVKLEAAGTFVTVQEGAVRVQPSARGIPPRRLIAGDQATITAEGFAD